jgi:GrpB-like predicted nucleotidyltransferase (UPF0157 family)
MAKKRRKPNLKNPNSKTWKNKADDLWKKIILSAGYCAVCGPKQNGIPRIQRQLHSHHLIGRTNLRYRHEKNNGICLCSMHHSLGGYQVEICAHGDMNQMRLFQEWLNVNKNDQYQWWLNHREDKRRRTESYQEAYERLMKGIEKC